MLKWMNPLLLERHGAMTGRATAAGIDPFRRGATIVVRAMTGVPLVATTETEITATPRNLRSSSLRHRG